MKNRKRPKYTRDKPSPENDGKPQILAIYFVGFTAMLLAIAGAMSFFVAPDRSRDVWMSVGPILTAAISGLLGFWAAKRRA
jgi:hypothetical protein